MLPRLFRRRSRSARFLDASRAGLERVAEAIPQTALADIFADLSARSGVDLADAAEQVFGRLSDAVIRAETSAGALADSETARQLRELAARAAGRAAELAYRAGAERLMPPPRRRSNTGLILFGAAAGLAAGGVLAYLLLARGAQQRPRPSAAGDGEPDAPGAEEQTGQALVAGGQAAVATVMSPFQQAIDGFRQRVRNATRVARDAQAESERRLWHEYRNGGPPAQTGRDWQG